jgi:hypothetical protein
MKIFHKLNEKFNGKLRRYSIERTLARMRGEDVIFSEGIAYIDALFDLEIFDHLHKPNIIGIERKTVDREIYLLFEIVGVRPMHYEMPSLTPEVPPLLKWEYLNNISESWLKGGENWMEIIAVHTGYMMTIEENEIIFEKTTLSPLVGSQAHIMSEEIIKEMVCKDPDDKYVDDIGKLIGYEIPLTIDIYSLFKYHTGIFGFTGTGKSNLTSLLIRKVYSKIDDIKIVIFDLSGEYTIHLLDLITKYRYPIYTDEPINIDRFSESQVIPESLTETSTNKGIDINQAINRIVKENINLIHVELFPKGFTVGTIKSYIDSTLEGTRIHLQYLASKLKEELDKYPDHMELTELLDINDNIKGELINYMGSVLETYSEKSNIYKNTKQIMAFVESIEMIKQHDKGPNIPELAERAVTDKDFPRITIFYMPEPRNARIAVSNFINQVFKTKKSYGMGNKILIVLDEAQEFIPDRYNKEDYTQQSNQAVEMLLRQGRKYLVGGWIATQRLAHLNTNALQQLHNYFVSTLPRSYDRHVVSDAFSISRSIVDKVTELDVGEWLFVSYKATQLKNVPVELRAYNNEDKIVEYLNKVMAR